VTTKGERTRQHLIDVAMACFERDGFGATTMRTIAAEAGVSVGLTYRYFDSKEGLVLAFYEQAAARLSDRPVEGRTLGARFVSVMRHKLELLAPHRRAMGSLMGAMLDPDGPVGALSPATVTVRERTQAAFLEAVEGAEGVSPELVPTLLRVAWVGHLLLLVAWVQRPEATDGLLAQVGVAVDAATPWLGGPMGQLVLGAVGQALAPFDPDP
jgi:AcrR family transcriptional regulator